MEKQHPLLDQDARHSRSHRANPGRSPSQPASIPAGLRLAPRSLAPRLLPSSPAYEKIRRHTHSAPLEPSGNLTRRDFVVSGTAWQTNPAAAGGGRRPEDGRFRGKRKRAITIVTRCLFTPTAQLLHCQLASGCRSCRARGRHHVEAVGVPAAVFGSSACPVWLSPPQPVSPLIETDARTRRRRNSRRPRPTGSDDQQSQQRQPAREAVESAREDHPRVRSPSPSLQSTTVTSSSQPPRRTPSLTAEQNSVPIASATAGPGKI